MRGLPITVREKLCGAKARIFRSNAVRCAPAVKHILSDSYQILRVGKARIGVMIAGGFGSIMAAPPNLPWGGVKHDAMTMTVGTADVIMSLVMMYPLPRGLFVARVKNMRLLAVG
jgi:hypothetical protein